MNTNTMCSIFWHFDFELQEIRLDLEIDLFVIEVYKMKHTKYSF